MIALKKLLMGISYRQVGCWTRAVWIALPIIASFACSPKPETPMGSAEVGRSHDADVAAVSELVEMYVQSINDADTLLAGEVWLKSDQVSFINRLLSKIGGQGCAPVDFQVNDIKRVRKTCRI